MPAGILIREFETDPSSTTPKLLCEQQVNCGPAPSVSQPFSPQTRFIVIKLGVSEPLNENRAVHCENGLDPLPSLIARWKKGDLDPATHSGINLNPHEPLVRSVGPGSRMAVLGLNLGHPGHPPSPQFIKTGV
jgi:hypothetical protein